MKGFQKGFDVMERKATSPIISIIVIIFIVISIVVALNYIGNNSAKEVPVYKIEFVAAYQTTPVSIENAKWQIVLLIKNLGNQDYLLDKVYLNDKEITETGLMHGDKLDNDTIIGTSLSKDGDVIPPGASVNQYIWIGGGRFSEGTQIKIDLNTLNQLQLSKIITLK